MVRGCGTHLLGLPVPMSLGHGLGGLGLVLVDVHPVARIEHAPPLRELGGTSLAPLAQPPLLAHLVRVGVRGRGRVGVRVRSRARVRPLRAHSDSKLREELVERALPPGGIDSGW